MRQNWCDSLESSSREKFRKQTYKLLAACPPPPPPPPPCPQSEAGGRLFLFWKRKHKLLFISTFSINALSSDRHYVRYCQIFPHDLKASNVLPSPSTVAFPLHLPTLKRQQFFGAVANSLGKIHISRYRWTCGAASCITSLLKSKLSGQYTENQRGTDKRFRLLF